MFAPFVSRSMIGEKLTFHIAAFCPRSTASPDCRTNFTGNVVAASSFAFTDHAFDDARVLRVDHVAVARDIGHAAAARVTVGDE